MLLMGNDWRCVRASRLCISGDYSNSSRALCLRERAADDSRVIIGVVCAHSPAREKERSVGKEERIRGFIVAFEWIVF